ncbi:hypothetical protein [Yersinia ruckeri]|uniref:hypothetical protein n=1 Tax=Yersinia ruckeri TaxID=29486 RepID=UPI002238512B|nr:hypothetical protein [Yersinia ruckeri]MCW6598723.1 hypothetical protein [Yersinia ruckeri]
MVKFYVKDLTLGIEVDPASIDTRYVPLEYSGDDSVMKKLKDWTVVFNLPLNASTVSGIELIRNFVREVIVTCTEESMIDHKYAAYLATKNIPIITPYSGDFRKNVELLKEVVGFSADIVVDSQFRYSGFALSLSPYEFNESTYAVIETMMNLRPPFLNDLASIPSLHLDSLAPLDSDPKEWRSALLEALAYYAYWSKSKWETKAYRWDSLQDTWL